MWRLRRIPGERQGSWAWLARRSIASASEEYENMQWSMQMELTTRIRPLKILCDPQRDALFFARNPVYGGTTVTDWLAEIYHRCHSQVCTRDLRNDPDHFDPLRWSRCPVEKCHFEAFEMAGAVSMFVPGTLYHPSFGVVYSEQRAYAMYASGFRETLKDTGGIQIFSAPAKAVEYGAFEWLEGPEHEYVFVERDSDHFNMEAGISLKKFMAGAALKNVSKGDAAVECLEALERGIRPALILHRFSLCKGDLCWFPPINELRNLEKYAEDKLPLQEVLSKLELPKAYINESYEGGLSYSVAKSHRSIAINLLPVDGGYDPEKLPAKYIESRRKKEDAWVVLLNEKEKKVPEA